MIRRVPLVFSWITSLVVMLPVSVLGQVAEVHGDADVREAVAVFVDAFNDLDWDRFSAAWASDATAFLPVPGQTRRVEGRDSIVQAFRMIFAGTPERTDGPPYLTIEPRDLDIHVASDMAVVTFHLGIAPSFDRRTIVFERREQRWLITHLHASRPPKRDAER